MKGIVYFMLFFSTICLTCKKSSEEEKKLTTCADKPLELPWIKDMIAGKGECALSKGATITMYALEEETLFLLDHNPSSVGVCIFVVYDCDGKRVGPSYMPLEDRRKFLEEHTNGIVIWEKK